MNRTRSLYAEFTVKPGHEERVAQLVLDLTVDIRSEPGNVLFNAYTRKSNPNAYFIFEIYRDDEAIEEHGRAEYGARFNAELAQHIEEDGSVLTHLEPVEK